MTLLEILVKDLQEWPERCLALSQDYDGEINHGISEDCFNSKPKIPNPIVWPWAGWAVYDLKLPVAEDHPTAIVTREMWENAKSQFTPSTGELIEALEACLEWIDAVPQDTVLPVMPGFDRDWVDAVLSRNKRGG